MRLSYCRKKIMCWDSFHIFLFWLVWSSVWGLGGFLGFFCLVVCLVFLKSTDRKSLIILLMLALHGFRCWSDYKFTCYILVLLCAFILGGKWARCLASHQHFFGESVHWSGSQSRKKVTSSPCPCADVLHSGRWGRCRHM